MRAWDDLAGPALPHAPMPSCPYFFLAVRFRGGTFAPFSRASLRPMAIACLRLFTLRPEPDLSVPFLRRRIALATVFDVVDFLFAMSLYPYTPMPLCPHALRVPLCP
jgi:hypothetical protein